jgi:hypothetical protein
MGAGRLPAPLPTAAPTSSFPSARSGGSQSGLPTLPRTRPEASEITCTPLMPPLPLNVTCFACAADRRAHCRCTFGAFERHLASGRSALHPSMVLSVCLHLSSSRSAIHPWFCLSAYICCDAFSTLLADPIDYAGLHEADHLFAS